MIRADARVRVVIVNYNGGALLERAVRSAATSQWPGLIDVVVVDNASTDASLEAVRSIPNVSIIDTGANEGFSANNHGFADLIGGAFRLDLPEPDAVALLNPDAFLRPDALRRLAGALNAETMVGAASPLILFDRPFLECAIETPDKHLVIDRIESAGLDISAQCHGVYGAERLPGVDGPVWLCPNSSLLRVPISTASERITFHVGHGNGVIDGVALDDTRSARIDSLMRRSYRIVQNAGLSVDEWGAGRNRGFAKRIDEPLGQIAPLWCGAAVVFHAEYLRDVGGFDERYFLYYEDVDLGLRGQAAGWSTAHVPEAVVEHRHSDRSGQGTELVEVLQHRNRLLTQVRHGSTTDVAKTFARAAATPVSLALSAVRTPNERSERLRLAKWRAKSLGQAVKGVGGARSARKAIDRRLESVDESES